MQQILSANEDILRILRKARSSEQGYRMLKYCLPLEIDDGFLLFNVLTREMVLLTKDEYENRLESDYLRQHWFVVPVELNEKEFVDFVRFVCSNTKKEPVNITDYTIFTTTDCNARCFYCFERGRDKTPMSEETAQKVASYIIRNCGNQDVRITWFGGEPLFNAHVIDIISDELRTNNIKFKSDMYSNGYLFDENTIKKATDSWALKSVIITLDGTEDIYNRRKAFIYKEHSAYQVVMQNIDHLLNAGVFVTIRLNMDLYNVEDLLVLVDELAARFSNMDNIELYASPIYDNNLPLDKRYSPENLTLLYNKLQQLSDRINNHGISYTKFFKLRNALRNHHCRADCENAVVITPEGKLAACDHVEEFWGHLDRSDMNKDIIASWQERCDDLPECDDCFYYPDCIRLKKCINTIPCSVHTRNMKQRSIKMVMQEEYNRWCSSFN